MIQVIVVGLAGARLMRAWTHEKVGEPFYEAVQDWAAKPVTNDEHVVNMRATNAKTWIGELFGCPHCLGFWTVLGFTVAWRWTPARRLVEALAAAMILSAIVDHYPEYDPEPPQNEIGLWDETVDGESGDGD